MIIYTIDLFDKKTEDLALEVNIPEHNLEPIAKIMKWNEEDKMDFINGIAVFSVNKEQAESLSKLFDTIFDTDNYIVQMSAGENNE
ncbi:MULTISPECIES: hypothetical protein [Rahnella]|uniref:DUF7683 domain-containing protein n=2 Tax=Rahnella TaxID=34037 RepID=A0A2L1UW60_9GAMM|nr:MULTISPECIES: hypothetical protein [Rahnella]AVF37189.1 hypothetical protein BV494_20815 [Rahnella sikkimica]MBF7981860.1 hypothetical protein [Rahnella laticis]MBF8001879.1 hypothetical protein [Rahnella sp. LAC-M12]